MTVLTLMLGILLVVLGMLLYTWAHDAARTWMHLQPRPGHLLREDGAALEASLRYVASLAIVVGLAVVALVTVL